MCSKELFNLDAKGKQKKVHPAIKTLTLEKNVMVHNRMRLMFFDAHHAYEMIFKDATDRERFYECTSALRSNLRVWCPDLCKVGFDDCKTSIQADGRKVEIEVLGRKETTVIQGETTVNASRNPKEYIHVWTGTLNLAGEKPPTFEELEQWIPKEGYDFIAISIQDAHYRKQDNEFYAYIQRYLGRPYILIAQMTLWNVLLCVFAKKSIMIKVANVEGATKCTKHIRSDGMRGGAAICFRYHETSLCFINLHLPEGINSNNQRQALIEDILDNLKLHLRLTDLTQQFHHTFIMGCLNYRVEMPYNQGESLALEGQYDSLLAHDQLYSVMYNPGIFTRFVESPINFPPTSCYKKGIYMLEEGQNKEVGSPSYTDRILWKNAESANPLVCTGYNVSANINVSNHLPVWATFQIEAQRPFISVFGHSEQPVIIKFENIEIPENCGPFCKSPLLMFWMHHVDGPRFSKPIKKKVNTPSYTALDLPILPPIVWHVDFLLTQHITIMLRDGSAKSSDLRGTALVPLHSACVGQLSSFDVPLEFHGRRMGRMIGIMQLVR